MRYWSVAGLGAIALAQVACGADASLGDEQALGSLSGAQELRLGSSGSEVRRLHDYYASYGYFPNDELQALFPAWRPIAEAPADPERFDAATEAATRAFQRNFGLPETGVADEATQALLHQPRCGFPDNIEPVDAASKWDLAGSTWGKTDLTWRLMSNDGDLSDYVVNVAIEEALAQYENASAHHFTHALNGTPDIQINYSDLGAVTEMSGVLGRGFYPAQGGDLAMNSQAKWSADPQGVAVGTTDAPSIIIHELGHVLGLAHDGNHNAVMYGHHSDGTGAGSGTLARRRVLTPDDVTSSLARKIGWTLFDNDNDLDVAVNINPDNGTHTTWVIGGEAQPGGRAIWKLTNKSTWQKMKGAAIRIAVNPVSSRNDPWVVNDEGEIYHLDTATESWTKLKGCANDIAVSKDDSVWTVGCTVNPDGNYRLEHKSKTFLCSTYNCFTKVMGYGDGTGGGVRISAGPKNLGSNSRFWVVNMLGEIWMTSPVPPFPDGYVGWERVPAKPARDFAAYDGQLWMLSQEKDAGGNFKIYVYQSNPADAEGPPTDPPAVARARWIAVPGGGVRIVLGPDVHPYVVNNQGAAYYAY